jgi:hypothetical protein
MTRWLLALLLIGATSTPVYSQATDASGGRRSWADVAAPTWLAVGARADAPSRIAVVFSLVTGTDGADSATVEMLGANDRVLESRQIGKSKNDTRTVEFAPAGSGTYRFRVTAWRRDAADPKVSEIRAYTFSLPLAAPVVQARCLGGGSLVVAWDPVAEAEKFEVTCQSLARGQSKVFRLVEGSQTRIDGLSIGQKYVISVAAVRGTDRVASPAMTKTIKAEPDREWRFTWFGQSSKAELNTINSTPIT